MAAENDRLLTVSSLARFSSINAARRTLVFAIRVVALHRIPSTAMLTSSTDASQACRLNAFNDGRRLQKPRRFLITKSYVVSVTAAAALKSVALWPSPDAELVGHGGRLSTASDSETELTSNNGLFYEIEFRLQKIRGLRLDPNDRHSNSYYFRSPVDNNIGVFDISNEYDSRDLKRSTLVFVFAYFFILLLLVFF
jgi:hypothetical protein